MTGEASRRRKREGGKKEVRSIISLTHTKTILPGVKVPKGKNEKKKTKKPDDHPYLSPHTLFSVLGFKVAPPKPPFSGTKDSPPAVPRGPGLRAVGRVDPSSLTELNSRYIVHTHIHTYLST